MEAERKKGKNLWRDLFAMFLSSLFDNKGKQKKIVQ